MLSQHSSNYP